LIGVVRGLMSCAALLLACFVFSPLPVVGLMFGLSLVVTCFVFSFLGVLVALIAKSHQDMSVFMSLVILPMSFLSGTFFSLNQVPEVMGIILSFSVLNQPFPWLSFLVLMGFDAIFFCFCFVVLRKASR
jgi:ABC-2 type transport system permease protein